MPRLSRRELQARRQLKKQKPTPPPQELAGVGVKPNPRPSTDEHGAAAPLKEDDGHGA
jgi:hypothetical protein